MEQNCRIDRDMSLVMTVLVSLWWFFRTTVAKRLQYRTWLFNLETKCTPLLKSKKQNIITMTLYRYCCFLWTCNWFVNPLWWLNVCLNVVAANATPASCYDALYDGFVIVGLMKKLLVKVGSMFLLILGHQTRNTFQCMFNLSIKEYKYKYKRG